MPITVSVPGTVAVPSRPAASAVVSTTTAQIAAQRQRDAVMTRVRFEAAYADSALAAANAAQAEQAYAARNRAVTAALAEQNAAARGVVPSIGTDTIRRTAAPEESPSASAAL